MQKTVLFSLFFMASIFQVLSQTNSESNTISLEGVDWKLFFNNTSDKDLLAGFIIERKQNEESDRWGNFISFKDNSFHTWYSAPCGVDCFTKIKGSLKWLNSTTMELTVSEITRSKLCQEESELNIEKTAQFGVRQSASGFTFKRL